ncbi:MAG: Y-family DNA polymerase [Chlorobiaceae bacterium]
MIPPPNGELPMFALVDCNNFYASCERVFNPALQGRPVVVLSNNDGCIIARSEEAKALGIRMGSPEFKCRELLRQHQVAVFSSNYPLYGDMSSRVMTTLAALAPEIEVYSIDEAFLDMGSFSRYNLQEYGGLMRRTVRQHTGIPVSIGIAPTKTLAKVANRLAKKNPHYHGVCMLSSKSDIQSALERTSVEDIWGIGRQWSTLLKARGIDTAADLAAAPAGWVRRHLHIVGARIQAELNGRSCLPMELVRPLKQSICTSRSFGRSVFGKEELHQAVATFAGKCAFKVRRERALASMLTVFVSTSPFNADAKQYWGTRTLSLRQPTQDSITIINAAGAVLDSLFREGLAYKKAGVLLSGMLPVAMQTEVLPLFPDEEPACLERSRSLMQVMDSVNSHYGKGSIRLAAENSDSWKPNQEKLSPCSSTRWSDIISVSA